MNDPTPDKPPGQGPTPPQMPNRFGRSMLSWAFVIGAGLILTVFLYQTMDKHQTILPHEFWTHAENGEIKKIVIHERKIEGELVKDMPGLTADQPRRFVVQYAYSLADNDFDKRLREALAKGARKRKGHVTEYSYESPSWWESLLPHILLMALLFMVLWFFVIRRLGSAASGGVPGQLRAVAPSGPDEGHVEGDVR